MFPHLRLKSAVHVCPCSRSLFLCHTRWDSTPRLACAAARQTAAGFTESLWIWRLLQWSQ